jgi:hypothetical protein
MNSLNIRWISGECARLALVGSAFAMAGWMTGVALVSTVPAEVP